MRFHPWWPTNGRAEPGGICHGLAAPTAAPHLSAGQPQWGLLLLSKTAIDRPTAVDPGNVVGMVRLAAQPPLPPQSRGPPAGIPGSRRWRTPQDSGVNWSACLQICYSCYAKVVLHLIPGSSSGN